MATKISYKDVVNFFDEINKDMAELVLGIIKDNLAKKDARRAKMSVNLKKARAAKGKGGNSHQSQSSVKADPQVQAEVAAGIPVHRSPGRPRRVVENEGQGQDQVQSIAESA